MIYAALIFAFGCFGAGLLFNLWRIVRGPGSADRILALDTMVINIIALHLAGHGGVLRGVDAHRDGGLRVHRGLLPVRAARRHHRVRV